MSTGVRQTEEIAVRDLVPGIIIDPGDTGTFDVSQSGWCDVSSAGIETRTLPDPTYRGQEITFNFIVDGGNVTVTANSPINQSGNTIFTLTDVGEYITLVGKWNLTDGWEWQAIGNDGAAVSGP